MAQSVFNTQSVTSLPASGQILLHGMYVKRNIRLLSAEVRGNEAVTRVLPNHKINLDDVFII